MSESGTKDDGSQHELDPDVPISSIEQHNSTPHAAEQQMPNATYVQHQGGHGTQQNVEIPMNSPIAHNIFSAPGRLDRAAYDNAARNTLGPIFGNSFTHPGNYLHAADWYAQREWELAASGGGVPHYNNGHGPSSISSLSLSGDPRQLSVDANQGGARCTSVDASHNANDYRDGNTSRSSSIARSSKNPLSIKDDRQLASMKGIIDIGSPGDVGLRAENASVVNGDVNHDEQFASMTKMVDVGYGASSSKTPQKTYRSVLPPVANAVGVTNAGSGQLVESDNYGNGGSSSGGHGNDGHVNGGHLNGGHVAGGRRYGMFGNSAQSYVARANSSSVAGQAPQDHHGAMQGHPNLAPLAIPGVRCPRCDGIFLGPITLRRHMTMTCGMSPLMPTNIPMDPTTMQRSEPSGQSGPSESSLESAEPWFGACDFCGKGFMSQQDRTIHFQREPPHRHHHCDICTARFETECEYVKHMKQEHCECENCNVRFESQRHLLLHLFPGAAGDDSRGFFSCNRCRQVFRPECRLHRHERYGCD